MARERKINDQQQAFIDNYVLTGDGTRSAEKAGYKNPVVRGSEMKKKYRVEIMEATKGALGELAPVLMKAAVDIALENENPRVRLAAIQDLLDRAGYKPVEKSVTEVSHVESQTTAELEAELEELLGTDSLRTLQ
jgi:phage terminase small subunit